MGERADQVGLDYCVDTLTIVADEQRLAVMPALVAGVRVCCAAIKTWIAGTSPDRPDHDVRFDMSETRPGQCVSNTA